MSNDNNEFQGRYTVEDGYSGGYRPQSFVIHVDDLNEGMTDEELEAYYDDMMLRDFQEEIHPAGENHSEFVAWAREKLAAQDK